MQEELRLNIETPLKLLNAAETQLLKVVFDEYLLTKVLPFQNKLVETKLMIIEADYTDETKRKKDIKKIEEASDVISNLAARISNVMSRITISPSETPMPMEDLEKLSEDIYDSYAEQEDIEEFDQRLFNMILDAVCTGFAEKDRYI